MYDMKVLSLGISYRYLQQTGLDPNLQDQLQMTLIKTLAFCATFTSMVFSCSSDTETIQTSDINETEESSLFMKELAGIWRVDQPFHAGYEFTLYDFNENGTLEIIPVDAPFSFPMDCSNFDTSSIFDSGCEIGNVTRCDKDEFGNCMLPFLTCWFGNSWRALDSEVLSINGDCSDGEGRSIELLLQTNDNAPLSEITDGFFVPQILSVGGESSGWTHERFRWAFEKCSDEVIEDCLFF